MNIWVQWSRKKQDQGYFKRLVIHGPRRGGQWKAEVHSSYLTHKNILGLHNCTIQKRKSPFGVVFKPDCWGTIRVSNFAKTPIQMNAFPNPHSNHENTIWKLNITPCFSRTFGSTFWKSFGSHLQIWWWASRGWLLQKQRVFCAPYREEFRRLKEPSDLWWKSGVSTGRRTKWGRREHPKFALAMSWKTNEDGLNPRRQFQCLWLDSREELWGVEDLQNLCQGFSEKGGLRPIFLAENKGPFHGELQALAQFHKGVGVPSWCGFFWPPIMCVSYWTMYPLIFMRNEAAREFCLSAGRIHWCKDCGKRHWGKT